MCQQITKFDGFYKNFVCWEQFGLFKAPKCINKNSDFIIIMIILLKVVVGFWPLVCVFRPNISHKDRRTAQPPSKQQ